MKSLISLLLLCGVAHARVRPVVISHAHLGEAMEVRRLLVEKWHLPADFITVVESATPCARRSENISWHLCVDVDGNLEEVHADVTFINQTLKVFL